MHVHEFAHKNIGHRLSQSQGRDKLSVGSHTRLPFLSDLRSVNFFSSRTFFPELEEKNPERRFANSVPGSHPPPFSLSYLSDLKSFQTRRSHMNKHRFACSFFCSILQSTLNRDKVQPYHTCCSFTSPEWRTMNFSILLFLSHINHRLLSVIFYCSLPTFI
jgi:hypothetical protein